MTKQMIAGACIALLGLVALVGCEEQVSYSGAAELNPEPEPGCLVGDELECECPGDLQGSRLCGEDGFFGECDCPDVPDPKALLSASPESLVFAVIEVGGVNSRTVIITNGGDGATEAQVVSQVPEFTVEGGAELFFGPGDSVELDVLFQADAPGEYEGALEVRYGESVLTVLLSGEVGAERPCLRADVEEIVFPPTLVLEGSSVPVTFFNCQSTDMLLSLSTESGPGGEFYADGEEFEPRLLSAGQSTVVRVNFVPEEALLSMGFLRVGDTVGDAVLVIPLSGLGIDPETCPVAVAGVRVAGTDGPLVRELTVEGPTELEFDGSGSFDPRNPDDPGGVVGYVWRLVEVPQTTEAGFVPNASDAAPQAFFEVPGRYVVELTAINQRGEPSCENARVVVMVRPEGGLRVELTWETPGDPIPDDERGGDLDLHLLREGGRWNTLPFDCYWQNIAPEWGDIDNTEDDPNFGGDALARGPEQTSIEDPERIRYRIGVHYGRDHGFGPSDATVRVYMGDVLVFEQTREGLIDPEFWEVAEVNWDLVTVDIIDEVHPDVP